MQRKIDLVKNYQNKFVQLTFHSKLVSDKHIITGTIKAMCARFFLFHHNNIPNTKDIKIYYESVLDIKEIEKHKDHEHK